jgi:tetratricopeptide (TPR) repeat protein
MCNAFNHSSTCTCGFGGIGHLGRGGGWASHNYIEVSGFRTTWRLHKDDFCRPTSCPICRAPVFFVRHNGGSVWFDELGKPWPKHGCFDKDTDAQLTLGQLSEAAKSISFPLYGIVVEVELLAGRGTYRIVVKCENNEFTTAFASTYMGLNNLVGELVVLSHKDTRIIHPSIRNETLFVFPTTLEEYLQASKNVTIQELGSSMKQNGASPKEYLELGDLYCQVRQPAFIDIQISVEAKLNAVRSYFIAGEIFRKSKRYKEAFEAYKKARLLDPAYPQLCFRIGEVLSAVNKYRDALSAFEQAIRVKPDDVAAREGMALAQKHLSPKISTPQSVEGDQNKLLGKKQSKQNLKWNSHQIKSMPPPTLRSSSRKKQH